MANPFVPGDLVISIYGDGNNDGSYTDNQASPIVLEDISTTGVVGASLVLPQTTTTVNGITQNAISGEYGSSSEGTLQLSGDGQSLTIAGYAINATTYNNAEANVAGSKAAGGVYGNNALAQTYSVSNGGTNGAPAGVTPVARVVADVRFDGTVDTSTALLNIDNENNPRSVVTNDGTSFYIAGQGVKGDTTQGLFYATDGASSATAINTATDQRTVEINNGNVYVSTDSKQGTGANKFTANISQYSGEPTAASTPTILPGISQSVTLTAAQENGINNGQVGKAVDLSPENFYFANSSTLYVADGGQPKGGGLGDGGLQKYSFSNNTWNLDYTLSAGLNLVANTGPSGTTGLIGLAGKVVGGNVQLYATNSTIGDTDPTYLYGITDGLGATIAPAGESFTQLAAAAPDTNIRGVAFAPQAAAAVCYAQGTRIRTTRGEIAVEALAVGDLVVTSSGEHRPIRWLGHRLVDCARHPRPDDVMPVRIAAHAFGEGLPARELVVSPGHSVCVGIVGEILIPAAALVNGTTIVQDRVDSVTYWHVELDSHDVILAENLPAESYLDMGNRDFFVGGIATALHGTPDASDATHAAFCRPFHAEGALVALLRERLVERAKAMGWSLIADPLADLHLLVDDRRLEPTVRGSTASFLLPAGATSAWLVSEVRKPSDLGASDARPLGLCVAGLAVRDGFGHVATIAADDARLCNGFHVVEPGPMRWTADRALLPAALWEGCDGAFFLRVDFAHMALPRWRSTAETLSTVAA